MYMNQKCVWSEIGKNEDISDTFSRENELKLCTMYFPNWSNFCFKKLFRFGKYCGKYTISYAHENVPLSLSVRQN